MPLTSAQDYLKRKGAPSGSASTSRSSGLTSAADYKARKIEPERSASPVSRLPLPTISNSPLVQRATAAAKAMQPEELHVQTSQRFRTDLPGGVVNPVNLVNRFRNTKLGTAVDAFTQGVGRGIGLSQEQMSPEAMTGNATADKVLGGAGQVASYFVNPGGLSQGPLALYRAAGNLRNTKLMDAAAKLLPNEGVTLNRAGTGVVDTLANKVLQEGAKELAVGAAYGVPSALIQGKTSAKDIAKTAAFEGGLGAASGVAAPLVGAGLRAAGRRLTQLKRSAPAKLPELPTAAASGPEKVQALPIKARVERRPNPVLEKEPTVLDELVRSKGHGDVTPETIAQTYNTKNWYHGTGSDKLTAETLDPFAGSHESLFGQGVYLTDSPQIAEGYANNRGRRSKTPTVYEGNVNMNRVLDLEKPITPDVADAIQKVADSFDYRDEGYISGAIRKEIANPGATPEKVITKLRNEVEDLSHEMMIPTSEFVENFQELAIALKQAGYDGLTHTGGARTGKDPHRVLIMLDPQDAFGAGKPQISRFEKYVPAAPVRRRELSPESLKKAREGQGVQRLFTQNGRPLLQPGSGTGTELVKRSDIIADLSEKLNIPIRVSRYGEKAHGIFKRKSGVVRSKLANDIPTISHEVGHALDKRYNLADPAFDNELMTLGQATSGPNYSVDEIRNEGIAEFVRHYLTEPGILKQAAPNFYAHFESKLPADVLKVLVDAQTQIRKYIDQPARLKSIAEMSIGEKEGFKLPTLNELYTKFVDELNPIRLATKQLGQKGKELFEDFWLLRGATGRAQSFLKGGVTDKNFNRTGKSLEEILAPVKKNLDDFRAYIKDKRALELEDRNIMTGADLTPAERQLEIRHWEQTHPEFMTAHKELKDYQDSLLKELVDSGFLSADDVATFKADNKEYVPFFRVYEAEAGAGPVNGGRTSTGRGTANLSNPIKRIKGSNREIIDPLESIVKNTYQYIAIAERNKTLRKFIETAMKEDGLGGLVEKVPTPMQGQKFTLEDLRKTLEREGVDTDSIDMDAVVNIFRPSNVIPGKENIITVFRGGKREFYQLDPDLYRAVTAADQDQMGMIVKALNFPVRILRAGVVNTLEFWLKNMFRDQFSAMNNSKNGYIPWIDMFRGMSHVIGRTDTFNKFLAAGGAQGLRTSMDRKYLQTDLRNILAKSMKDKAMNVVRNPLEAMRLLSEFSEMGTRIGEFSKGLNKDGSPQGVKAAALAARDLIDFGRAGTWGKNINKVSAFWNAQVQGLDKTIRTFSDPKTAPKAFVKSLALISVPTVALYMHNKDDPRYQELQDWDKDLFWHFWVGDKHFRLPIPFELGVMFKVIPERIARLASGEERPLRELGKTAWENISPIPKPLETLTALAPLVQAFGNQNALGGPIVPKREEGLLPEDQAGPYTSHLAQKVAKIPFVKKNYLTDDILGSPRKVDHLIQGYLGSLGKYGSQLVDEALDTTGVTKSVPKPDTGLETAPLFKAFLAKSLGGNSDSLDKFYERKDELDRESRSASKKKEPFEKAGEQKQLAKLADAIGEVGKALRAVEIDPDLSGAEKAQHIRELNLMITNLARAGLNKEPLNLGDLYPSMKE